jgi:hypothetical protein
MASDFLEHAETNEKFLKYHNNPLLCSNWKKAYYSICRAKPSDAVFFHY